MRNAIEVSFDVHIDNVGQAAFQQLFHASQGVFTTTSGSIAAQRRWPATFLCILLALSVALPGKFALKDWFNNHSYGGLHDAISDRGDSQWSFLIRYAHPFGPFGAAYGLSISAPVRCCRVSGS